MFGRALKAARSDAPLPGNIVGAMLIMAAPKYKITSCAPTFNLTLKKENDHGQTCNIIHRPMGRFAVN
jgi:hypothetical protein